MLHYPLRQKKMRQEDSETKMGKGCSIRAKRERDELISGQQMLLSYWQWLA